jgi:hypothetical protein
MEQGFGNESPRRHTDHALRKASRYLVLIDSGGSAVAKLFLDTRELVAEFDASTEETALMTRGLSPVTGAEGAEWDKALRGHSANERREATVYTLDV